VWNPLGEEGEVSHMALSADGKMLAYVSPDQQSAVPMLHVQRVGSTVATVMPGTEGASFPFWSPDDAYVAFFARGKLFKLSVAGGQPRTLAGVTTARGGSWGKKNVIIYAPVAADVLWKVTADGSTPPAPLTAKIVGDRALNHAAVTIRLTQAWASRVHGLVSVACFARRTARTPRPVWNVW
jgi:hypothetical protein